MRTARIAAWALAWAVLAHPAQALSPRAAGGVGLIEAAVRAPATVVGEIGEVRSLDRHGRSARLTVEVVLRGPLAVGSEVQIAWEELAASRAPRFAAGERVLVALERLPGASIWRERLTDAKERQRVLAVAMRGDAFLRRPTPLGVGVLQHYVALAPRERGGATGVGYLVDLAAGAETPLAADALGHLERVADLDDVLGPDGGARLAGALLRSDVDASFRGSLAALIAGRGLESTRPALEAFASRDPAPPAAVFEALAGLDGGLDVRRTASLRDAPAPQRRVAARHASGPGAEETLRRLLLSDPAPEVRVAAVERLAEIGGEDAIDPLLRGLSDTDADVRGSAARQLAGLGEPAVSPLRQVVDGNDPEAAAAAVVALGLSGAPGARSALREIAGNHSDPGVRALADIALGRPIGHRH